MTSGAGTLECAAVEIKDPVDESKKGHGERAHRIPDDPQLLLHQMTEMCDHWLRHAQRLTGKTAGEAEPSIDILPASVVTAHKEAMAKIGRLGKTVQSALITKACRRI